MAERYFTFPLSGEAYGRGRAGAKHVAKDQAFLTHTWDEVESRTLCQKVKPESILDDYALPTEQPPTCAACLKLDPRFK